MDILDVAAYILQCSNKPMTTMKLQKLAYYCQAWHLAWNGKPLFDEQFQAWANGPVCYELYLKHRGKYSVSAEDFAHGDASSVDWSARHTIDTVLAAYGPRTGTELSVLTHADKPWIDARGGTPSGARSEVVITHKSMRAFYAHLGSDSEATLVSDLERPDWV